jgi:hypothetical protein
MIALGVLQSICDLGLRCPQNISLVGFDDLDFAPFTSPSLTSVFQPGYQLGANRRTNAGRPRRGRREPGKTRQITVYVDPVKLQVSNMSLMDVVNAVNESNLILPGPAMCVLARKTTHLRQQPGAQMSKN